MAMTALQILKLLPRTNCKECGRPTCMVFAVQLAQKKANLDECPHASEEAKEALGAAAAPPVKLVRIGSDKTAEIKVGEETVLCRHEEKFHNPAGVCVTLSDTLEGEELAARLNKLNALHFVRVGTEIQIDGVAVVNDSGDGRKFAAAVQAASEQTDYALVLVSESAPNMKQALAECAVKKPLIHAATSGNAEEMAKLAKDSQCPLAVKADTLEATADLTEAVKGLGVEDLVLDVTRPTVKATLVDLTRVRRAAIRKQFRPLGFPCMAFAEGDDAYGEMAAACTYMAKYAGVVVTRCAEPSKILPLLTVRTNIYTDPQKPVQVEPKLYAVGEPDENSPVLFTTNFSLTYYSVEGDVEASRMPTHILAVDTEGTSVLTAFSGDKLNEKTVSKAMEAAQIEDKVSHRKLIIPGYVAVMSGKLEEETGWEIMVGPKESSALPAYLKQVWAAKS